MAMKPSPVGLERIPPFIRTAGIKPFRGDGDGVNGFGAPQQRLYFRPDPQGHGSFLLMCSFMTGLLLAARFVESIAGVERKVLRAIRAALQEIDADRAFSPSLSKIAREKTGISAY